MLVTEILHITWVERNQVARQGNHFCFPLAHVIGSTMLQIEVLSTSTSSPQKVRTLQRSSKLLAELFDKYDEQTNR